MRKAYVSVILVVVLCAMLASGTERMLIKVAGEHADVIVQELKDKPFLLYFELAKAYFKTGDVEKAKELFLKSTKLQPEFAEAFHNAGVAHYDVAEYDKAIEYFTLAIEKK